MNIAHSLTDLIGNTPLLALERALPNTRVLGKLECMNPLSSAKDRAAWFMIYARFIPPSKKSLSAPM